MKYRPLTSLLLAGKGRLIALVLLFTMIVINLLGQIESGRSGKAPIGDLVHTAAYPFATGRQILFDAYQRAFPRKPRSQPVTIVAIDDKSLLKYGQWPWPRTRLAELIDTLSTKGAAAIGLDIYMPEADQTSPEHVAANLLPEHQYLAKALRQLPMHDAQLAVSLRNAPSILGVAGFDFPSFNTVSGIRSVPLLLHGKDPRPFLKNYPYVLASLPEFQMAAHGQAVLSIPSHESTVVRRLPLVMASNNQPVSGLAMEMLRVATDSSAVEIQTGTHGVNFVQVADLSVPTQHDAQVWLHYAPIATLTGRYLSVADVLNGDTTSEMIAGKLILIGLTGSGLSDMWSTTLGELVPGVEIQAQLIENLFDQRFIQRPGWFRWFETLLMVIIGLAMIWRIPQIKEATTGTLKKSPRSAAYYVTSLNLLFIATGYVLFCNLGFLFDAASIFIVLTVLLISLSLTAMIQIDQQTRRLEEERHRMRENEARVAGEMAAARRIQLGSLPDPKKVFAGEKRFVLASLLEPAREVGGDLYDFFMVGSRYLYFMVGDASGKGVPASLFIATAKTLIKNISINVTADLGEQISLVNRELSQENAESLFVTLILGKLDIESGALCLVNAGHDAPWKLSQNRVNRLFPPVGTGGPPLCVVDDFTYTTQTEQLVSGDILCLLSDGIIEAVNARGEPYGTKRLENTLQEHIAHESNPEKIVHRIKADVDQFSGTTEALDDRTLLVIRWQGIS